ncbi:MAG: aminopeptidase N [bacterium]|nr:aminopeptidase N [bacterium]
MNANPRTIFLKDYQPFSHEVLSTDLIFDLYEDMAQVTNKMKLVAQEGATELVLDGAQLALLGLKLDGKDLDPDRYRIEGEQLTLTGLPARFSLEILTEIRPAENRSLEGLYQSGALFCTQCEPQGFRKITYFPDRPDVMTLFTTEIRAEKAKYPVLLSNGNRIGSGDLKIGRHWAKWEDPFKKPAYLFALVAGNLTARHDSFTTMSGRKVALELYTEPENAHKTEHGMESLKKAMKWDEEVYGLEYDLDIFMIVSVNDFNMGAMENKGLNIFNSSCVLADPRTATDAEFEFIMGVIGHEYFHNWSGNRVTCRDWFQLSLKEGLTIFRDQQFSSDLGSAAVKRIDDAKLLRTSQFAEDGGPMAHPVRPESYIEINNFYTLTVYQKGAELIRMMYLMLGKEAYYKGVKLYFERNDGTAARVEDFVAALEEGSGQDLTRFGRWYHQAGTPRLSVETTWNEASKKLTLTLSQSTPPTPGQETKLPLVIPVKLKGFGPGGEVWIEEQLAVLEEEKTEFVFEGFAGRPILSLLRGFSAPVRLDYDQPKAERLFLMAHDDDPFNAVEAAQGLMMRQIDHLLKDLSLGSEMQVEPELIEAIQKLIEDPSKDMALVALAVSLPSEQYILEQMPEMLIEPVLEARKFLKGVIAMTLAPQWNQLYRRLNDGEAFRFDSAATGKRRLKNLALDYLVATEDLDALQTCLDQYDEADNMTDRLSALSILVNRPGLEKHMVLADFFEVYCNDALVLNKFFSLQAASPEFLPGQVAGLLEHPSFDKKNPNNLRAVLGSFALRNLKQFHAADGSGYQFLASQILWLNDENPQIAARLLLPLSRWARFPEDRRELARELLEKILAHEGLSPDVYEVAAKSLGR